jgi:hypothetical protein
VSFRHASHDSKVFNFIPSDPNSTFVTIRRNPNDAPLSPTHYPQPSTPEHAPPSAEQAERYIHDRIRPLSQVSEEGHYLPMDQFKYKNST